MRYGRVFFTLCALAGSNPFSFAVFVCKGLKTKKLPLLGAFSTKMAGYVRVSTNTYVYGIRRGFALLVTDVTL